MSESAHWDGVLDESERRSIAARLGADLVGTGLLAVGLGLAWWRPDQAQVAAVVQALAALVVGVPILLRGLPALASLKPRDTTDQLVSLAVLAAMAQGSFATATLVPLVLDVGRLFEERTSLGARAAIDGLKRLQARSSTRLIDGEEVSVDPSQLEVGHRLRVRPGEVLPVDGRVVHGHGAVDQAAITGESRPEDVGPEDTVYAGTLNVSGLLEIEVTGTAGASVIGRVAALLREVSASRPPVVRTLEALGAAYVPIVLVLAATTLFFTESPSRAITVLVVAAPTALVVAGPAAMVAALAAATRSSILVKRAEALELAVDIDTLVVDKTGTLTEGVLALFAVHPEQGTSVAEVLATAAACGHGSLHPVSRAAVAAADDEGIDWPRLKQVREVAGRGAEALDGTTPLRFGRPSWLRELGIDVPQGVLGTAVSRGNRYLGAIELRDRIRPEASDALAHLRAQGVHRVVMVTGDRAPEAERVGEALGLDAVVSEALPEEKLAVVRAEQAAGRRVAMLGDGVNDALALSAADLGVAIGAHVNEIALGGADVALLCDDPGRLGVLLKLARSARRVLFVNLALGLGLGVVLLGLAMAGRLSPIVGALLHDVGAILVVAHSARLLQGTARPDATHELGGTHDAKVLTAGGS